MYPSLLESDVPRASTLEENYRFLTKLTCVTGEILSVAALTLDEVHGGGLVGTTNDAAQDRK